MNEVDNVLKWVEEGRHIMGIQTQGPEQILASEIRKLRAKNKELEDIISNMEDK